MGLMEWSSTEMLIAVVTFLLGYLAMRWWKDPLRQIPGPAGLPLLGNALSIDINRMHMQFYDMALKYGPIMKISIFNEPIIILNSTNACLEALIKTGTDIQGRPHLPRTSLFVSKDLVTLSYDHPHFSTIRRVVNGSLKAYGAGIAHLEGIMQQSIAEAVDIIHGKDSQPINVYELINGFVCSVINFVIFGERYAYDDPMCMSLRAMNDAGIKAVDPLGPGAIFDLFPFLINFKFILPSIHKDIDETLKLKKEFVQKRIDEAKATFDRNEMRGCLDYFIEAQRSAFDEDGNVIIDDGCIQGLVLDFIVAGMETSLSSLSQAFLDILHDPQLQKRIQLEIDTNFEPTHVITIKDKHKLPLLESYLYEILRYTSTLPFLLPHSTIRDTEIAGYKIPTGTRVIMNSFNTSHNPDVYEDPFTVKPERFLDEDGKLVEPGHPLRQNFIGFGVGRRSCPGELLARTRIFLFLANILQKFTIEPVGELPDRDVRKYKMGLLLNPPPVTARFVRRL